MCYTFGAEIKQKIPSQMKVAPRYKLLTLFTLLTQFTLLRLRGLRGTTGTRGAKEKRRTRRTRRLRGIRRMRGLTGLMWLLYIVIWLKHHGDRLYGIMGLLSKMLARMGDGWMGDTPVTTTRAPVVPTITGNIGNR